MNLPIPEGVPEPAWRMLAREDGSRWAIAERDADGEVIGTAYRDADGGKTFAPGGKRGLIVAWPLHAYAGTSAEKPVFVCEGASDTAALLGLGLDAVGTPMAGQCGRMLADLLADRHAVIVADADPAGRNGAAKLRKALVGRCQSVRTIEPPSGVKDAREAVKAGADAAAFLAEAGLAAIENAEPETPAPTAGGPVLIRLSDVQAKPVSWLWEGRFAVGKLTLVAGDPGLGKSFLTLDMAARVSTGAAWPDRPGVRTEPGGVVLLNAEDALDDTIRPRLDAAGADTSRIIALSAIRTVGEEGKDAVRSFDLSRDLPALEDAIRAVGNCRLAVIDPVTAYLGGTDSHKNAEIRGLLAPLGELAERHGVAVTHLNKSGGGPAIYRAMGSLAFAAAARAAWAVSKDKDDPARRLFIPIKNNIAPDTGGLGYRIEPGGANGCPTVCWEPDPVHIAADDALAGDRGEGGDGALEEAKAWLRDALANGARPAKEVKQEAESDGIKPRTLDRAKKALGLISTREGYASEGRWVWSLPHSAPTNPKNATLGRKAHNGEVGAQSTDGWGEL